VGEIKYKNGDKYYGYSLNHRPHGQGIYTNKLGEKFSGEFIHGEITYGTIKFPDGKRYTGDLKIGNPTGMARCDQILKNLKVFGRMA
jgi:hypothetical protein